MKNTLLVLLCSIAYGPVFCQYYLRGEIKDERGRKLDGVRILLASKGNAAFYSGSGGTFGITTHLPSDTITLVYEGYDTLKSWVSVKEYQSFLLKMQPSTLLLYTRKLLSATTNLKSVEKGLFEVPGESYSKLVENGFVDAAPYPETGFALTIDKASYSNLRRFLSNDMLVPTDAIRIEEMLNYFDFTKPEDYSLSRNFRCRMQLTSCPWNRGSKLFFINLVAPKLNLDTVPPSNLVFLIDISGSMDKPNRLPLLQGAFSLLIENLRKTDTITLVTYGGNIGIALPPTSGAEKQKIRNAISELTATGDTPGEDAIRLAYAQAKRTFMPKGNNRVILATDGDFNIGQTTEKELEDLILGFRKTGIYLTCLGVGMGNYKDSKLETLAKKGNGNFAYLDNLQEAQKVLVTEFTQTLYSVASNAFLKIRFNPSSVQRYRLIGYDNKNDAMSDTTSKLEGGEIGSGHSMMAMFEIEPAKNDSTLLHHSLANIVLQYETPTTIQPEKQEFSATFQPLQLDAVDSSYRFAAAVAALGSLLKQSKHLGKFQLEEVRQLALSALTPTDIHQLEFLSLIDKAMVLYKPVKKKKRK